MATSGLPRPTFIPQFGRRRCSSPAPVVSSSHRSSVSANPSTSAHLLHYASATEAHMTFPLHKLLICCFVPILRILFSGHLCSALLGVCGVGNKVVVGNGRVRDDLVYETDIIKGMRPLSHPADSPTQSNHPGNKFEGKDALSYANLLRSQDKFGDVLILCNIVLEKESDNLEALVAKGICLQAQNLNYQAFDTFHLDLHLWQK